MLTSFCAIAGLPELFFENVNGDYTVGKGKAHVMDAKYKIDNVELMHEDIEVTFNRAQKNLVLLGPNTIVHFGFDFSFLNVFKTLNFKDININLKEKEFITTAGELYTHVGKYDYTISGVDINAEIQDMNDPDNMDQILDSFIKKGAVKVKRIIYSPISIGDFKKELASDNIDVKKLSFLPSLIKASLRMLKVEVKEGQIIGSVLVDSWLNAWLRFRGRIINVKKSNILRIELTKAKLGYFGVKKFVLKSLRRLESEKIKVKGNIIEISID
jgi:hypothetical protein